MSTFLSLYFFFLVKNWFEKPQLLSRCCIYFALYLDLIAFKRHFCFLSIHQLGNSDTPIHRWYLPGVPDGFEVYIKREDMSGSDLSGNKVSHILLYVMILREWKIFSMFSLRNIIKLYFGNTHCWKNINEVNIAINWWGDTFNLGL